MVNLVFPQWDENQRGQSWWHFMLHLSARKKISRLRLRWSEDRGRLKAEGAGRVRSALTSQRMVLALPPVASPVHLSPTVYSSSSKAEGERKGHTFCWEIHLFFLGFYRASHYNSLEYILYSEFEGYVFIFKYITLLVVLHMDVAL